MISIIIPVLNEADTIERLLDHLAKQVSGENELEIIIVDGGSTDSTREIVSVYSERSTIPLVLFSSEKGRAKQMNVGAKHAKGGILYFLHADSFPPKDFDKYIQKSVKLGHPAGCFRMKFDSSHPVLKFSEFFTRFNYKFCRGGDQSLFITKELFQELGGFDEEYVVYEDCEFINRIYDHDHFYIIPKYVRTSSRKYKKIGTWKLQYHFAMIHFKKGQGASPEELYQYYKKNIQKDLT